VHIKLFSKIILNPYKFESVLLSILVIENNSIKIVIQLAPLQLPVREKVKHSSSGSGEILRRIADVVNTSVEFSTIFLPCVRASSLNSA